MEEFSTKNMTKEFKDAALNWQKRMKDNFEEKGLIKGPIKKHVDEKKKFVKNGWQILNENNFNPLKDLFRDEEQILHIKKERKKFLSEMKDNFLMINDM